MATRQTKARDLACVRIGFNEYLMDADKAMQVLKLMRESVECEREFGARRRHYVPGQAPQLELTMVDPSEIYRRSTAPQIELGRS